MGSEMAKYLLDCGASVQATTVHSWNALHCAAISTNNSALVADLIDAGCDVNGRMVSGFCGAQHITNTRVRKRCLAAFMGIKFASLLPRKKTGPIVSMFANMRGLTPLMCAVAFGRHEVALALMDAGADVSLRSHNGMTAYLS